MSKRIRTSDGPNSPKLVKKKPEKVGDIIQQLPRPSYTDKSILSKISYAPRRNSLALLSVLLWAWTALCLSALIVMPVPEWKTLLFQQTWQPFAYSLQIPMIILVGGTLGGRYGTLMMLAYIATGLLLGFPIFSNGGGMSYLSEPTIGYLAGLLFTPIVMHQELKKGFAMRGWKGWMWGQSFFLVFAALMAVLLVHTVGVFGLIMQVGFGNLTWPEAMSWLSHFTFQIFPYDAFFAVAALCLVRLTRFTLFCCLY